MGRWLGKSFGIVLILSIFVTIICFSGQPSLRLHIAPGQIAKSPIIATLPFTYESAIQTQRLKDRKAVRVAPIYKLDLTKFQSFVKSLTAFIHDLSDFYETQWKDAEEASSRGEKLASFVQGAQTKYRISLRPEDLEMILVLATEPAQERLWNEGLEILQFIAEEGIVDSAMQTADGQVTYFMNIDLPPEQQREKLRTQEDALLYLRIHLNSLDRNRQLTAALFHILRQGIHPNLIYDRAKTEEKKQLAASFVKPVMVSVEVGDTIIDGNVEVTPLQYEKLLAYRLNLLKQGTRYLGINHSTWASFVLTFAILFSSSVAVQILFSRRREVRRGLWFFVFMLLANLLALRLFLFSWEVRWVMGYELLFRSLPFMAPIFIGPILISLLLGRKAGLSMALLLDIFYTLMIGKNLDFFVVLLLALLLAVYLAESVFLRSQILRIATVSGGVLGLAACAMTLFENCEVLVAMGQLGGAPFAGLYNGLLAMFFLSPFERCFRLTSNVRLQELSDFNHKLLRQLQVYAPGTYHHSLMVSTIAEQAALEVGARALLCRVCGLFHDLGKMTKPEYFIENQMEQNPHHEKSPRISTLIIKSHVRDGVEIGRAAKLPIPILEMTQQHHGTTLIQYFYNKALSQRLQPSLPIDDDQHRTVDLGEIDESFYRYDGPKPQTLEAAIVMFSDSIEAASRSLSKITPQSVDSLVDAIFQAKIDDCQLDECEITYRQIHIIKKSISSTLVNMLHSRISYTPKVGN